MPLFVEAAGVMSRGHGCGWKGTLPEPRSLSPGVTAQAAGGSEAPQGREWEGSGPRPPQDPGWQEGQLSCGFAKSAVRTQS